MKRSKAYIDSFYHGSAVDGKGLRSVVFFSGCNLRCGFCHNPETLFCKGTEIDLETMVNRIKRYTAYIRKGGVTLSGGEPFLQAAFCKDLIEELHKLSLNVCIETNGHLIDWELLAMVDGIILDVKNQDAPVDRINYDFLKVCEEYHVPVQLTNVLVPGRNDDAEHLKMLDDLRKSTNCVTSLKFLPFHKMCVQKYEKLNRSYPYDQYREADSDDVARAEKLLAEISE